MRRLCRAVREALGREDAPILIDQEGGRVQRIGPPHFRAYPAGSAYAALYRRNALSGVEAAFLGAKLIALDLAGLGVTVDCLPVLDIPAEGSTSGIGDRALGDTVDAVATLGGAQLDGLLAGGVLPVIKHMPGHGRATVDSHHSLPQVDATMAELEARDFTPFRLLAKRARLGMTAHVAFLDVDGSAPATLSSAVIANIIRERIGFDGALMTDDISMGALTGGFRERAERAIAAGCDLVLHCNGNLAEMQEIATGAPELAGDALRRTEAALQPRPAPEAADRYGARAALRLPPRPGRGMSEHRDATAPVAEADFEEADARAPECLVVDVAGFEGPLDLLLSLAREQKVDLAKISILALAEQYLAFIEAARRLRLEIAADYLVMAAWLAYLKSRLLLPEEEGDAEPSGEELALILARRLKHLEAIREAGRRLMASPRLGHEVFARGTPEPLSVNTRAVWDASLYDLLSAYAALRLRGVAATIKVGERPFVFTLQEARERLMQLIGTSTHWETLDSYLVEYLVQPKLRATARASAFSASLELVKEGEVELKQTGHFTPLFVRRRAKEDAEPLPEAVNG